jgi:hypothetical protein
MASVRSISGELYVTRDDTVEVAAQSNGGAPDDMKNKNESESPKPVDTSGHGSSGRVAESDPGESHLGAVEGDRPTDRPNQGNPNAPGLDENGMPNDPIAICEDVIGANVDGSEGG